MRGGGSSSVHFKAAAMPFCLDPNLAGAYTNVQLISSDGYFYTFNGAMLASASSFLRTILLEEWSEAHCADIVIQTEVPKSQLALVHSFVNSGLLAGDSIMPSMSEAFATFGISLNLSFEKVHMDWTDGGIPRDQLFLQFSDKSDIEPLVKIKEESEEKDVYYSDGEMKDMEDWYCDEEEDQLLSLKRKSNSKVVSKGRKTKIVSVKRSAAAKLSARSREVPLEVRTCICCGVDWKNRNKLARHYDRMTMGKDHVHNCPRCPQVIFESWFDHQEHVDAHHGGVFSFWCMLDNCSETFKTIKERNAHRRS